jgi:energy-converting hydrogenase Eha subunit E
MFPLEDQINVEMDTIGVHMIIFIYIHLITYYLICFWNLEFTYSQFWLFISISISNEILP